MANHGFQNLRLGAALKSKTLITKRKFEKNIRVSNRKTTKTSKLSLMPGPKMVGFRHIGHAYVIGIQEWNPVDKKGKTDAPAETGEASVKSIINLPIHLAFFRKNLDCTGV